MWAVQSGDVAASAWLVNNSNVCWVKPLGGDHCSEDAEKWLQIVLLLPRSSVFYNWGVDRGDQRRPPQDEE